MLWQYWYHYSGVTCRWWFPEAIHYHSSQDQGGSEEGQYNLDLSGDQYRGFWDSFHLEKEQCCKYSVIVHVEKNKQHWTVDYIWIWNVSFP